MENVPTLLAEILRRVKEYLPTTTFINDNARKSIVRGDGVL